LNWKEFKTKVEAAGVQDDDELLYIDSAFDFPLEVSFKHKSCLDKKNKAHRLVSIT
jgi:hypothetical protein